MDRFLLDTNIVTRLVFGYHDELSSDVGNFLSDYNNQLYTGAISAMELAQLHRLGKIDGGKKKRHKSCEDLLHDVENTFDITALPFGREYMRMLSKLVILPKHNDPFDHAIIAHAITEKLTLISSDTQFESYVLLNSRLRSVFNKR